MYKTIILILFTFVCAGIFVNEFVPKWDFINSKTKINRVTGQVYYYSDHFGRWSEA